MTFQSTIKPSVTSRRFGWFADRSLYVKLIVAFVIVAAFSVATTIYFSNRVISENLINQLGNNMNARASAEATIIANLIRDRVVTKLETLALSDFVEQTVKEQNASYTGNRTEIQAEINRLEALWVSAGNNDPFVLSRVNAPISNDLRQYQRIFTNNIEIFVTDRYGGLVSSTNRTSDYNQSDEEWWQQAWNNGQGAIYVGQPNYDESSQTHAFIVSIPIYASDEDTAVIGIMRTTYKFNRIAGILTDFRLGNTGQAQIYFPSTQQFVTGEQTQPQSTTPENLAVINSLENTTYIQAAFDNIPGLVSQVPLAAVVEEDYIKNLGWKLVVHQDLDEAFQPVIAATQGLITVGIVLIVIAIALALVIAQLITSPIRGLNQVARQWGAGDLSQRTTIQSKDEIGQMAQTMNQMAEQLAGLVNTLEARIAARTRDMETAVQVNAQISTILDTDRLLQDVVDLTKERFRLYHAHIYLLDETGQNLVLKSGAGHVGRQMVSQGRQIEISNPQSIVAQAARGRQGVIINDVAASPTFLENPLLPDTHSELAVPLFARGQLLGVLDVQSNQVDYFSGEVLAVMELMAGQIATAISNAQLYEVADRTSRHEKALGAIDRRVQDAVNMDEILQTTVRELGKALRVPYTAIELQLTNEDVSTTTESLTE